MGHKSNSNGFGSGSPATVDEAHAVVAGATAIQCKL